MASVLASYGYRFSFETDVFDLNSGSCSQFGNALFYLGSVRTSSYELYSAQAYSNPNGIMCVGVSGFGTRVGCVTHLVPGNPGIAAYQAIEARDKFTVVGYGQLRWLGGDFNLQPSDSSGAILSWYSGHEDFDDGSGPRPTYYKLYDIKIDCIWLPHAQGDHIAGYANVERAEFVSDHTYNSGVFRIITG